MGQVLCLCGIQLIITSDSLSSQHQPHTYSYINTSWIDAWIKGWGDEESWRWIKLDRLPSMGFLWVFLSSQRPLGWGVVSTWGQRGWGPGPLNQVQSDHLAYFNLIYISHFQVIFHWKTKIPF